MEADPQIAPENDQYYIVYVTLDGLTSTMEFYGNVRPSHYIIRGIIPPRSEWIGGSTDPIEIGSRRYRQAGVHGITQIDNYKQIVYRYEEERV